MPCRDKIRQREHQRKHYRTHKEYYRKKREVRRNKTVNLFKELKASMKCSLCSESDPVALDFHHIDGNKKESLIIELVDNGRSWTRILEEIKKCAPLCANCHRKVHKYPEWLEKLRDALEVQPGLPTQKGIQWATV